MIMFNSFNLECQNYNSKTISKTYKKQSNAINNSIEKSKAMNIKKVFKKYYTLQVENNNIDESDLRINIFPNPVDNILSFNYNAKSNSNTNIIIVNTQGLEVLQSKISIIKGEYDYSIDVSSLTSGVYYLIIDIDGLLLKSNFIIIK